MWPFCTLFFFKDQMISPRSFGDHGSKTLFQQMFHETLLNKNFINKFFTAKDFCICFSLTHPLSYWYFSDCCLIFKAQLHGSKWNPIIHWKSLQYLLCFTHSTVNAPGNKLPPRLMKVTDFSTPLFAPNWGHYHSLQGVFLFCLS